MSMVMHSIMRHNKHENKHQLKPKQEHHHAWRHVQTPQVQQQNNSIARCTLTMMSTSLNRSMMSKSMRNINMATHLPRKQRAA